MIKSSGSKQKIFRKHLPPHTDVSTVVRGEAEQVGGNRTGRGRGCNTIGWGGL